MKSKTVINIVVVVVALAITLSVFVTDLKLVVEPQAEALRIKHNSAILLPKEDFEIPYDDITNVEILRALPRIRKVNGLDNPIVRIGAFRSDIYGDFSAYIRIKEADHLVIYTADKTYIVTPRDTEAVYAEIRDSISSR